MALMRKLSIRDRTDALVKLRRFGNHIPTVETQETAEVSSEAAETCRTNHKRV